MTREDAAPDPVAPDPVAPAPEAAEASAPAPAPVSEAWAAARAAILADPEALLGDPELVQALLKAHEEEEASRRKVIDLRGALLNRLESRLGRLEETHRTVVSAAYDNLAVTDSIHRAVLAVLTPTTFEGVLDALAGDIPAILGVDGARLCVEADAAVRPDAPEPPLVALSPGAVARYMALDLGEGAEEDGPERPVALRATGPEAALIFGPDGVAMGSEALVRLDLGEGAGKGMLAFGARDAERFGPDQAGDLLEFFGAVMALVARRWLVV